MPFLSLASIQRAGSHFSSGIGESSKIVPTLDLLRRIVAVPKKEADEKVAEDRERRAGEKPS
jgi:hypothetical protein